MSKGLEYFQKVYDVVPGWVAKMHEYSPKMLDCYTDIRGEAFADAAISAKEKDVLVAAMNAGRLYARSMVYHTKGAIDKGITIEELVEYHLVAYLYKGTEALKLALESIAYAYELKGKKVTYPENSIETIDDVLDIISDWTKDEEMKYFNEVAKMIKEKNEGANEKILGDGKVTSELKYLAMIGCYVAELNGKGAKPWIEKAKELGFSESKMADMGYVCIMTAGIPSWFELSDSLV